MSTTVLGQLSSGITRNLSGHLGAVLTPAPPTRAVRRVRHEVRDGIVVIAFSAVASTVTAVALLLLVRLAG
jgi:hypothetical protein